MHLISCTLVTFLKLMSAARELAGMRPAFVALLHSHGPTDGTHRYPRRGALLPLRKHWEPQNSAMRALSSMPFQSASLSTQLHLTAAQGERRDMTHEGHLGAGGQVQEAFTFRCARSAYASTPCESFVPLVTKPSRASAVLPACLPGAENVVVSRTDKTKVPSCEYSVSKGEQTRNNTRSSSKSTK